jgi:hypothetical protein
MVAGLYAKVGAGRPVHQVLFTQRRARMIAYAKYRVK